jgi:hypothetical protein
MTDNELAIRLFREVMGLVGQHVKVPGLAEKLEYEQLDFECIEQYLLGTASLSAEEKNAAFELRNRPKDAYGYASYNTFKRFWKAAIQGELIDRDGDAAKVLAAMAFAHRNLGATVAIEYSNNQLPKPKQSLWGQYANLTALEDKARDAELASDALGKRLEAWELKGRRIRSTQRVAASGLFFGLVTYLCFFLPVKTIERPLCFKRKTSDSLYLHAVLRLQKPMLELPFGNKSYKAVVLNLHAMDRTGQDPDTLITYTGELRQVDNFYQLEAVANYGSGWCWTAHLCISNDTYDPFNAEKPFWGTAYGISKHETQQGNQPTGTSSFLLYLPAKAAPLDQTAIMAALRGHDVQGELDSLGLRCNWLPKQAR